MTTIAAERVTNPASGAAKARERPILFSGEMVRAILDGRKTMTRRVVKPQPYPAGLSGVYADLYHRGPEWAFWLPDRRMTEPRTWPCPFGQPGDKLWVRETWAMRKDTEPGSEHAKHYLHFKADGGGWSPSDEMNWHNWEQWRSPIFMPRWASRITLEITAVRVERVQDISEGDAKAEGLQDWYGAEPAVTNRGRFHAFWDSLNAKRGYEWDANPWAWVITFRRLP